MSYNTYSIDKKNNITRCLDALIQVIGKSEKHVALHEPCFTGNEWEYVKNCLDTGWVSSVGEYVDLFEKKLSAYTGISHAIVAVNGTCALHMSLLLVGVQPDDEVLVPALTFVATANAVSYCGAIPHFIDSHELNLGLDIEKLRLYLQHHTYVKEGACFNKKTQRRIKAVVPVHIFGHPVEMKALQALTEEFHLAIVEDASESLGSYYHSKHTGHFSDVAVLSFNGNKIITTGGGGAILTNDPDLAQRAKHLTTTAKRAHRWEFIHDAVGYNYRLPNINAALGCAQMEQLDQFIEKKRQLAQKYLMAFAELDFGTLLCEQPQTKSNYWLNAFILHEPNREFIAEFMDLAFKYNYGLRGLWTPLHLLPMYQDCPKMDLSNTQSLYDRVIALPSSASLGESHA